MKKCNWPFLIISLAIAIAILLAGYFTLTKGIVPLTVNDVYGLQLSFTKSRFIQIIKQWQEAHLVEAYLKSLEYDFIFLAGYSLSLSLLIMIIGCVKKIKKRRALAFVPIAAGLMDMTENIIEINILTSYNFSPLLIFLQSLAASIKFLAVIISIILIIWLIIIKKNNKSDSLNEQ